MSECCDNKTLDGLNDESSGGGSNPNEITGDLLITGDLNVQGGDFVLGVGADGWSNIRSATAAFGLDLEAPAGKKIRLINDVTPIVEITTSLDLPGSTSGVVSIKPQPVTTTYDFNLPIDPGLTGQVLTSQGAGVATYWSAGGGVGGGTVTSVALTVPAFLSVAGSPITTAGTFTITLSGTPLPVLNGGTGTTTSQGTGSVVLNNSPTLVTPTFVAPFIGTATGFRLDLNGLSSGTVSIAVQANAGTFNFNLPVTPGFAGQVLTSGGGGASAMTWTTLLPPGTGTVTSVDITVPAFLSVTGNPITTSGTLALTLSGTPLPVLNGGTGTTTSTGTGSVVLSTSPTLVTTTLTGTTNIQRIIASDTFAPTANNTLYSFTNTSSAVGIYHGITALIPNAPVLSDLYSGIGKSFGTGNTMLLGYHPRTGAGNTFGSLSIYGDLTRIRIFPDGTASTSTTTGQLTVPGGVGILTNLNIGGTFTAPNISGSGQISTSSTVDSTSSSTGSITTLGGVGIAKTLYVGLAINAKSALNLSGSTSGTVSILVQPVAGTYNFNLPTTSGTPGQVLTSQGGAASEMTWTTPTPPGTGTVTSVALTTPAFLNIAGSPITTSGTLAIGLSGTPLPVLNGGTGTTTSTGTGSTVLSTSPIFVNPSANNIAIRGATSGIISILPQAITTTYNFNLPTTAGTSGQVLTSQGGSTTAMTWSSPGTGTVTSVALAVPAFLNVSGSPIVTNGTITVGLSGTPLLIANGGTSSTTATGTGSVVLQTSPTLTNVTANGTSGLVVGGGIHANFTGLESANQKIKVSPNALNAESSISYFTNVGETGSFWAEGQLSANYFVFSSSSSQFKIQATPTGPVTTPSGLTSTSTTDSTSPTTGSLQSSGGLGVAKTGVVGGLFSVNFSGTGTTPAKLHISPNALNAEASTAYYTNVGNSGNQWNTGQLSGNYFIYTSQAGRFKMVVPPTAGPVDFPDGISTNGDVFSPFKYARGTTSANLLVQNHTVTGGSSTWGWTRLGAMVVATIDIPNFSVSGLVFGEASIVPPFPPSAGFSCPVTKDSDFFPLEGFIKNYVVGCKTGETTLRFSGEGYFFNEYVSYDDVTYTNCHVQFTITYLTQAVVP